MPQFLFDSDFTIPNDTVLICGSGKNADGNYHKIREGEERDGAKWFKIACNKAIEMPLEFDAWGIADRDCVKHDYFLNNIDTFKGWRIFSTALMKMECCDYDKTILFEPKFHLGYKYPHYIPINGEIKVGGTIAGCMIQVAYWFGKKRKMQLLAKRNCGCSTDFIKPVKIRLLGVDMFDNRYFDGTFSHKGHNRVWTHRGALNAMVQWMKEQGADIKSLSPTELDVEVV